MDDEVAIHFVSILGRDKPDNDEVVASASVNTVAFAPVGHGEHGTVRGRRRRC
ncbi:MAG: hypothetical protein M3P18_23525 [Actinomycetota bacterium]|nr:hypothetical protein [Actinomycetota bacterium]